MTATVSAADWTDWQRRTHALRAQYEIVRAAWPADHPALAIAADAIDLVSQVVTAGALSASLAASPPAPRRRYYTTDTAAVRGLTTED